MIRKHSIKLCLVLHLSDISLIPLLLIIWKISFYHSTIFYHFAFWWGCGDGVMDDLCGRLGSSSVCQRVNCFRYFSPILAIGHLMKSSCNISGQCFRHTYFLQKYQYEMNKRKEAKDTRRYVIDLGATFLSIQIFPASNQYRITNQYLIIFGL